MEEFRVCMAVDDAGLAFDARSRYLVRIVLVDGSHGAYGGAFAAVVAFFKIGERFCLEEFCRLTVFAQRNVVGAYRSAVLDGDGPKIFLPDLDFRNAKERFQ